MSEAPLVRAGVLGDVHAEDVRVDAALAWLASAGVDRVLSVGDIVDGQGSVDRACAALRRVDALAVRGNHERWLASGALRDLPDATAARDLAPETLAFLSALPPTRRLATVAGPLLLCHGLGDDDMNRLLPDDTGYAIESNDALAELLRTDLALVVNGHTHRRMVRTFGGGRLTVINAGTLARDHEPGFFVVDFSARTATWHDLAVADRPEAGATIAF